MNPGAASSMWLNYSRYVNRSNIVTQSFQERLGVFVTVPVPKPLFAFLDFAHRCSIDIAVGRSLGDRVAVEHQRRIFAAQALRVHCRVSLDFWLHFPGRHYTRGME